MLFWKNKLFGLSVKKLKWFGSSVKKIKCFWWLVKKKYLFAIWPIFTYTKYDNKWEDRPKREKNYHIWFVTKQKKIIWFSAEHKKINNSDVKTLPPLDIKWLAPHHMTGHMTWYSQWKYSIQLDFQWKYGISFLLPHLEDYSYMSL